MTIDADILHEMFFEDKIIEVSLMGQLIESEDAALIAKALAKDPVLQKLDLGRGQFGDAGAKALGESLATNTHLKRLDLNTCKLTDDGIKALADGLSQNNTLEHLSLYSNDITDEGAIALAEALKKNTSLVSLTLDYNRIGEKGAAALADAMGEHPLNNLGLGSNCLGDEGAVAIATAGGALKSLTLFKNAISDDGAAAVADHLFAKGKLQSLDISTNHIGDAGAKAMVRALDGGSELNILLLSTNRIGEEGMQAFADFLRGNDTLTALYLDKGFSKHEDALDPHHHKNIMQFNPADESTKEWLEQNATTTRELCERLSLDAPHSVGDILMAGDRLPAIRDIVTRYADRFSESLPQRIESAVETLPTLGDAPTRESLTAADSRGFSALDNAKTWRDMAKILPLVDKAFLLEHQNRDGEPLLANAVYAGKLPEMVAHLNARGEKLTPDDLLAEDGKTASPVLDFIAAQGEAAVLFRLDNWVGQSAKSLQRVYEALPDDGKSQVKNYHSLKQQVSAAQPSAAGIGR